MLFSDRIEKKLSSNEMAGFDSVYQNEALLEAMREKCQSYLDERTFYDVIALEPTGYKDELELFISRGETTMQKVLNNPQHSDSVYLRRPEPKYLPIRLARITDDEDPYLIPSAHLTIDSIMTRAPRYKLDAVICKINGKTVVFAKNQTTEAWYYYQKNFSCDRLHTEDSELLNDLLATKSDTEQERWMGRCHFLITLILYNAVKYIYIPESR